MSGQEIERRDTTLDDTALLIAEQPMLVVPFTGKAIDLRNLEEVAAELEKVRELKRGLEGLRTLLEDVLRLRSRELGTKTLHLAGVDAVVSGGTRPEYHIELLAERLRGSGLPQQRLEQLIVATVSYRVDQRVARELRGANAAYAAALDESRSEVPAPWRVTVKRRG